MTNIKVFQIDDWAFVAAETQREAEEFISKQYERPDDLEDRECDDVTNHDDAQKLLADHIADGGALPFVIGINSHYA